MSYITPITNRTIEAYYNTSDISRLINNISYLNDFIATEFGIINTLPYTLSTPTTKDFVKASLINKIEANINSIRDYLNYNPSGWQNLNEDWIAKLYAFKFGNANNLEADLDLIYVIFNNIKASLAFYKCGSSRVMCGGGYPIF